MNSKISVIVPVYNSELYLEECIESVLNQTYDNFELILINDGSTDNSKYICDKYEKKDNRVRVKHICNSGVSVARNIGISISTGEYIVFVDSDDYINLDMLKELYNYINKYNTDMVICDFMYYKNNVFINSEVKEQNIKIYTSDEAQCQLYKDKYLNFIVVWGKIYKRKLFNNVKFPQDRIHEDEFIAHRIINECKQIAFIPNRLYYYRIRENSITNNNVYSIKRFDKVYAIEDRLDFYRSLNLKSLISIVDYDYIYLYFLEYFKYKQASISANDEFKEFKNRFKNRLKLIQKSNNYSFTKKVFWYICYICPIVYLINNKISLREKVNGK